MLRLLAFCCSSTVTKGVKISTQFELRFRFTFRYVVSARRSNCTGFLAVWRIPLYSLISATLLLWIYIGTAGADRLMSQYLSLKVRVHFTKNALDRTAYETTTKFIPANCPPNGDDARLTLMVSVPHFSPILPAQQKPAYP